jgi:CheY-like chemotaxis protein
VALAAINPANPPDLFVTDLNMPGIDGWRFCRLLHSPKYVEFNQVPIIVISATLSGEEPERITADLGAEAIPAPLICL